MPWCCWDVSIAGTVLEKNNAVFIAWVLNTWKIQLSRSPGSCMYHSSEVAMPVAFLGGGGSGDKKSFRSARTKSKFHLFAFVGMTLPHWSVILNSLYLIEKYKKIHFISAKSD